MNDDEKMSYRTIYAFFVATALAAAATARDFDPRDYGAKGDGRTFDTAAVQRAIDECAEAGGGRVVVDGGTYLVKPIQLRSGVELHQTSFACGWRARMNASVARRPRSQVSGSVPSEWRPLLKWMTSYFASPR